MDASTARRAFVELPLPRLVGSNSRAHWSKRSRDAHADRQSAHVHGLACRPDKPFVAVRLVIDWWCPTRRMLDCDNALSRCKAYLDGLTDAGWWLDDKAIRTVEITVHPPGERKGCVTIEANQSAAPNL